jgi:hypothetical protein
MKSALIVSSACGFAVLASSLAAFALATAVTTSSTSIQESASIQVVQGLDLATQIHTGFPTGLSTASVAKVTMTGGAGDAVSLAVSPTLDVTRASTQEKLVVQTFGGASGSSVLGGALRANGALSIDVGGHIALAGRNVSPGSYQGLLVVIAQYN